ncbi:GNAT family N-acetyltransferase [Cohnella sp. GCM10027633]|uniref:GNAT family N-acetyltransferase n=1 Tax=unclassified Cohnella TaxID=2636738 RepID=UPI00363B6ABE
MRITDTDAYTVERVNSEEEASRIVEFLFSQDSFDDNRHTPGEVEHFRSLPYRALRGELVLWHVRDEEGRVIAINCVAENEQRTGGYSWDYIVVHRAYRKSGVATALISEMLSTLRSEGARYVMTFTCSLPEYASIRRLFAKHGFRLYGTCPDYYYEGEDRLIYGLRLD